MLFRNDSYFGKMQGQRLGLEHGHVRCRRMFVTGILITGILLVIPPSVSCAESPQPNVVVSSLKKMSPTNWKVPSFRLPNFLVAHKEQDRIVERKNGLVTDVKDTASRSWKRTKETFSPARLNPMNLFAGGHDPSAPQSPSTQQKPGFFSSMFSPRAEQPVERVATVNEFLDQPRQ